MREVVRLERVAERLADSGVRAAGFASAYTDALAAATVDAVAVKSILAYRSGFAVESGRPSPTEVRTSAARWLARPGPARLDDPVLLRFVLWCGVDRGLPVQIHTGIALRWQYSSASSVAWISSSETKSALPRSTCCREAPTRTCGKWLLMMLIDESCSVVTTSFSGFMRSSAAMATSSS